MFRLNSFCANPKGVKNIGKILGRPALAIDNALRQAQVEIVFSIQNNKILQYIDRVTVNEWGDKLTTEQQQTGKEGR